MDTALAPFKRIILRAILNDARPIVARVIAVFDDLEISDRFGFRMHSGVQIDKGRRVKICQYLDL
jgi:hypothetical protein